MTCSENNQCQGPSLLGISCKMDNGRHSWEKNIVNSENYYVYGYLKNTLWDWCYLYLWGYLLQMQKIQLVLSVPFEFTNSRFKRNSNLLSKKFCVPVIIKEVAKITIILCHRKSIARSCRTYRPDWLNNKTAHTHHFRCCFPGER